MSGVDGGTAPPERPQRAQNAPLPVDRARLRLEIKTREPGLLAEARARARGQSGRDGILAKDSLSPTSELGSDCFLTRPIL